MAGETVITVVGNLTDDPELRFTPSGAAVASFTVASADDSFGSVAPSHVALPPSPSLGATHQPMGLHGAAFASVRGAVH